MTDQEMGQRGLDETQMIKMYNVHGIKTYKRVQINDDYQEEF